MAQTTKTFISDPNTAGVFGTATGQLQNLLNLAPDLYNQAGNVPGLDVSSLSPTEMDLINQIVGLGQNNPDMAAARGELSALTSGPIGSSPLTAAGMKAFTDITAPQVMQAQALQGTASGGAATEAMANAASAAALPLIQQEIGQREAAVGQYSALGNQQMSQLADALVASGMPRDVANQKAQALFNQQQQKWQYLTGLQTMPLSLMGRMIGTKSYNTPGAMDWLSAGLSGAGSVLGSL